MRRASEILFLVGMIVSIIVAVGCGIAAITLFVLGGSPAFKEVLIKLVEEGKVTVNYQGNLTSEQVATIFQGTLIGCGVPCLFISGFAVANAVFSSKAKGGKPTRTIAILNIVFGILSDVYVNVVGAILSLIQDGRDERRQALENKVE